VEYLGKWQIAGEIELLWNSCGCASFRQFSDSWFTNNYHDIVEPIKIDFTACLYQIQGVMNMFQLTNLKSV